VELSCSHGIKRLHRIRICLYIILVNFN
jgi:hypothetical protein